MSKQSWVEDRIAEEGKLYVNIVQYIIIPEKKLIKDDTIIPIQTVSLLSLGNDNLHERMYETLPKNAKILKIKRC